MDARHHAQSFAIGAAASVPVQFVTGAVALPHWWLRWLLLTVMCCLVSAGAAALLRGVIVAATAPTASLVGAYALGSVVTTPALLTLGVPAPTGLAAAATAATVLLTGWQLARKSRRDAPSSGGRVELPWWLIHLVAFGNALGRTAYGMASLFLVALAARYDDEHVYVLGWWLDGGALATFAIAVGGLGFAVGSGVLTFVSLRPGPFARCGVFVLGGAGAALIAVSGGWLSLTAGVFAMALVGALPQLLAARVVDRAVSSGMDPTQVNAALQSRVTPYTGVIWTVTALAYLGAGEAAAMLTLAAAHVVLGVLWFAERYVDGAPGRSQDGPPVLTIIRRRDSLRLIFGILCIMGVYSAVWTPLALVLGQFDRLADHTPAWTALIGLVRLPVGLLVGFAGHRARVNEYRAARIGLVGSLIACVPLAAAGWLASGASPLDRTTWAAALTAVALITVGLGGIESGGGVMYVAGKAQIDKRRYLEVVRLATVCAGALGVSLAQFLLAPVPPVWSVGLGAGFAIAAGVLLGRSSTPEEEPGERLSEDPDRRQLTLLIDVTAPEWHRTAAGVRAQLKDLHPRQLNRPQQVRVDAADAGTLRNGDNVTVRAGGELQVSYRAYQAAPRRSAVLAARKPGRFPLRRRSSIAIGDAEHGRIGALRTHVDGVEMTACELVSSEPVGDVRVRTYRVVLSSERFARELTVGRRAAKLRDDAAEAPAPAPRGRGLGWLAGAGLFALLCRVLEVQGAAPPLASAAVVAADAAVVGCALLGARAAWRPSARLADAFWALVAAWLLVGAVALEAWRAALGQPQLTPRDTVLLGALEAAVALPVIVWARSARTRSAGVVSAMGVLIALQAFTQIGAVIAPSSHWALAPWVAGGLAVARALWELTRLRPRDVAEPAREWLRADVARRIGTLEPDDRVYDLRGPGTLVVVSVPRESVPAERVYVASGPPQPRWRTVARGLVASGVDARIAAWLSGDARVVYPPGERPVVLCEGAPTPEQLKELGRHFLVVTS